MRVFDLRIVAAILISSCGFFEHVEAASAVTVGADHVCSETRGSLQCWGKNSDGQLGTGGHRSALTPMPVVGLNEKVGAMAAGSTHTCAVVDGGLDCWGTNDYGQLGTGDITPSAIPIEVVAPGSGVTAVAAGRMHTCAVINGGLQCWGNGDYGQLGIGQQGSSYVPVAIPGLESGVTDVVAGRLHTCAIVNGALACWGGNDAGQLGIGSTDTALAPAPVALNGTVTSAAAGAFHTCAVVEESDIFCWGSNGSGELGTGSAGTLPNPFPIALQLLGSEVNAIVAGGDAGGSHTCAIVDGGIRCWGYNAYGQLGNGTLADSAVPTTVIAMPGHVAAIATGAVSTCARNDSGQLYCWGSDREGALGDGGKPLVVRRPDISRSLNGFNELAAGNAHGCGLLGGAAYCWGSNADGQLGQGTLQDAGLPAQVDFGPVSAGVESLGAGSRHSCAVLLGDVYCWGSNEFGQLGDGSSNPSMIPVSVNLTSAATVVGGGSHTCALLTEGTVRCWGGGAAGQLGNGVNGNSQVPVIVKVYQGGFLVPMTGATAITAGDEHSCAIVDGGVRCWGNGSSGQLGAGTHHSAATAVPVAGLAGNALALDAGGRHTCVLVELSGGEVECWGANSNGQLGNGTLDSSPSPIAVRIDAQTIVTGASSVAAGLDHSCAISAGGVLCWGANNHGQLGVDTTADSSYAVASLPPGSGVTTIVAGDGYTCAASASLTWCWGYGYNGRLGNGSLGYASMPVLVDTLLRSEFED